MSENESKVKLLADETSGHILKCVGDGSGEVMTIEK